MIKKLNIIFLTFFFYLIFVNSTQANFQEKLIKKYKTINTLHFDFTQKIGEKVEFGNCYIKYPLLMKCEYPKKKKSIITNGKKFAIVKKRYKKIYYYPIRTTPLFFILKKEKIINLIRKNQPTEINSNFIVFEFIDQKTNKLKILFDKNSLEFKGWKAKDSYSNDVSFTINNLKINNQIIDDFFKIPREEDL